MPFGDGTDLFLTDEDHYIPDGMIVCDRSKIKADGVHGAPDLVIEVLSPGTAKYDRGRKKDVYEKCGVKEYWIVSPTDQQVEQYLFDNGKLALHDIYAIYPDWMLSAMSPKEREAVKDSFKCSLYEDLSISLNDVFSNLI